MITCWNPLVYSSLSEWMNRWMSECVCGFTRVCECLGVCPRTWKRGCVDVLISWCVSASLRECVGARMCGCVSACVCGCLVNDNTSVHDGVSASMRDSCSQKLSLAITSVKKPKITLKTNKVL